MVRKFPDMKENNLYFVEVELIYQIDLKNKYPQFKTSDLFR